MQDMAIFAQVVETGSFAAAASRTGLSPSAISKLIGRLEDRLGIRLFHRTTRRIALTPEGEIYLKHARQILTQIGDMEQELSARAGTPRGKLRVNTNNAFGTQQLLPALPLFMQRYPQIELDISMTDTIIDLIAENVDVAIRAGRVVDNALMMRKICDIRRIICASPAYLEQHGTPETPDQLLMHQCLTLSSAPTLSRWPFMVDGEIRVLDVGGRVKVDNVVALLQLARAGMGIIRSVDNLVGHLICDGALVPLLQDTHHEDPVPFAAVYPQGRHRSPAIRAFVDFLVEEFSKAPWRKQETVPSH